MVEIKIVDILAYSTEDPRYPARNLMFSTKWLTAKNFRGIMNEVTLKLEKCTVISAIDLGNCGTAIVTVEVSRTGLKDFYTLIPAFNLMTREDSLRSKNLNSVKMFQKEDMCEDIRDDQWDRVRIICTQPFKFDPFGLSFIRFFYHEESPLVELQPASSPGIDAFIKRFNTTPKNNFLTRSERLLLEASSTPASTEKGNTCPVQQQKKITSQDMQNDHSPKAFSGGKKEKQAVLRKPDLLSKACVPKTTEETRQRIKSIHKEPLDIVRKKQGQKETSNNSISKWLINSSSGPSTSSVQQNSVLHLSEKREKLNARTGKQSEDDDSDSTVLNIASSPDSTSSQMTITIIRSSSEEGEVELGDSISEKTSFQRGLIQDRERPSEKPISVERNSGKQCINNHGTSSGKSNLVERAMDKPVDERRVKDQGRLLGKHKIIKKSVHQPKEVTIEISDNESSNSDDTVIIVKPSPEKKDKRRRRVSPPRMFKKSRTLWLCSEPDDSARKPSTFKNSKSVTCPMCSKDLPASDIEEHAAQCEPEEPMEERGGGRMKCPVCERLVPKEVLEQHVNACLDAL